METLSENFIQPQTTISSAKFLAFMIEDVNYGISIDFVTEIIEVSNITHIPNSPPYFKGVINLRGKIIPTIDLRLRLGMLKKEYNSKTCIIIVNPDEHGRLGLIVDMVSEVFEIPAADIESSSKYEFLGNENFLDGIGKINEKAVMILNIRALASTALWNKPALHDLHWASSTNTE